MKRQIGTLAFEGVVLVAIGLGTDGCSPGARGATDAKVETLRRASRPNVSATLSEDILTIKVEQRIECQDITQTPSGEQRSPPTTCDTKPVSNALWSLIAGRISLTGTTDANGLAAVEFAKLVDGTRCPESAAVTVSVTGWRNESTYQVSSMRETTACTRWMATQATEQEVAAKKKIQDDANQRQATAEASVARGLAEQDEERRAIDHVEADLTALERSKEPWGEALDPIFIRLGQTLVATRRAATARGDATNTDRLDKLAARWRKLADRRSAQEVAEKKITCRAIGVRILALLQESGRIITSVEKSVCYGTCLGNGLDSISCLDRCDTSGIRARNAGALNGLSTQAEAHGCDAASLQGTK